jgi:Carboxypeptidase regulatory-like domain
VTLGTSARRLAALLAGLALLAVAGVGGTAALDRPTAGAGSPPPTERPTPALPADGGTAWGVVLDEAGVPVVNANVSIAAIDAPVELPEIAIVTGADGRFVTFPVPAGRYELTIDAWGHEPLLVEVEIEADRQVGAGEIVLGPEA